MKINHEAPYSEMRCVTFVHSPVLNRHEIYTAMNSVAIADLKNNSLDLTELGYSHLSVKLEHGAEKINAAQREYRNPLPDAAVNLNIQEVGLLLGCLKYGVVTAAERLNTPSAFNNHNEAYSILCATRLAALMLKDAELVKGLPAPRDICPTNNRISAGFIKT